jgi:hypothetical protein
MVRRPDREAPLLTLRSSPEKVSRLISTSGQRLGVTISSAHGGRLILWVLEVASAGAYRKTSATFLAVLFS